MLRKGGIGRDARQEGDRNREGKWRGEDRVRVSRGRDKEGVEYE